VTSERPAGSIWLRPERAAVGRPAQRSRAEITAIAIEIADREGLDAVSMRRVAAELGTGAASLYRYVETREELLDLMADAVGGEYELAEPGGDWLADLLAVGEQSRAILRRHPWLPGLIVTRPPSMGPNGVALLEHVLAALEPNPASIASKMEAFAMLNSITAAFALNELGDGAAAARRTVAYLGHVIASGERPRLARLLSQPPAIDATVPDPADRYPDIMRRVLVGLLAPSGR
jgi:AcrR family transcriptional regulator